MPISVIFGALKKSRRNAELEQFVAKCSKARSVILTEE
jgi:hypothetical protein